MKKLIILSSLILASFHLNASTVIVGGTAPMGDANAWIEQVEQMRMPQSSEFYKNKVLAVPAALNHGGIFPTCAAMILLYHDETLGLFPDGVENFLTPEAMNFIASTEYFADYYFPDDSQTASLLEDKSGPLGDRSNNWQYRPNNCIADASVTSQSVAGARAGMTVIADLMETYQLNANVNGKVYQLWTGTSNFGSISLYQLGSWVEENRTIKPLFWVPTIHTGLRYATYDEVGYWDQQDYPEARDYYWTLLVGEINANRPLIATLNTGDHPSLSRISPCVTVVGYAEFGDYKAFAAYNGTSYDVQWYFLSDIITGLVPFPINPEDGTALTENAVHRFFNPATGAYFFTAFTSEAQNVIENNKAWKYQGPVFRVEYGETEQNTPVYRFYNKKAAAHFYTANEQEKENVIANLSANFSYEGVAFYVRSYSQPFNDADPNAPTYYPIYRCFLPQTSSHYFTASKAEVDFIQQYVDSSLIQVEGIAWYSDYIWDVK